jgi:hypothetical protein
MWFLNLVVLVPLPSLEAELRRFPPHEVVQEYLAFNRGYQGHLESWRLLAPHHAEEIGEALGETRRLYWIWDKLDDAWGSCAGESRWEALRELRSLLGDEAYFWGRMPPPVPLGRFQEID